MTGASRKRRFAVVNGSFLMRVLKSHQISLWKNDERRSKTTGTRHPAQENVIYVTNSEGIVRRVLDGDLFVVIQRVNVLKTGINFQLYVVFHNSQLCGGNKAQPTASRARAWHEEQSALSFRSIHSTECDDAMAQE